MHETCAQDLKHFAECRVRIQSQSMLIVYRRVADSRQWATHDALSYRELDSNQR